MTEKETSVARLTRCGACRGKIKVDETGTASCPLCGLTLLSAPRLGVMPPLVAPRADEDSCWRALAEERRLPEEPGATELRRARLLLVPYWRMVDESKRSITRPGQVMSAADLSPVGLPCLTAQRRSIAGLQVEPRSRSGDAMGRLEPESAALDADMVEVMLGPEGESPRAALDSLEGGSADASRPWWQLLYYPVWSFHYVVYNKEQRHVVDAVSARPVGPARRLRPALVATAAMASMLLVFVGLEPLGGAAAAAPAWLAGLAAMRLTLRAQRGG